MSDPTPNRTQERLERAVMDGERALIENRSMTNAAIVQIGTELHQIRQDLERLSQRLTQVARWGGAIAVIVIVLVSVLLGIVVERKIPDVVAAPPAPITPTTLARTPWLAHLPREVYP